MLLCRNSLCNREWRSLVALRCVLMSWRQRRNHYLRSIRQGVLQKLGPGLHPEERQGVVFEHGGGASWPGSLEGREGEDV